MSRSRAVFIAVLTILALSYAWHSTLGIRTSAGSGNLAPGDYRVDYLFSAEPNSQISGEIIANDSVQIYILHSNHYTAPENISELQCQVCVRSSYYLIEFTAEESGDWVLVLENRDEDYIHYNFTWSSIPVDEQPFIAFGVTVFPLFTLAVAASFIVVSYEGSNREEIAQENSGFRAAIIGSIIVVLTFIAPLLVLISPYSTNIQSPLWDLRLSDGLEFRFWDYTNPFSWVSIVLMYGIAFFFPHVVTLYYQGRTSAMNVFIMGLISTSLLIVSFIMSFITSAPVFIIPIPISVLVGLLLVQFYKLPQTDDQIF
ncbi:hypothetical protein EU537_03315 [Candidatus Thorarchaeota archaeon]|nr:MAG: hypothetical protein EU537_03315 [Candidatus Thorarchaeota archaeon]